MTVIPTEYEFTATEIEHMRAGRFEKINVRPLRARIAAALYEAGLFVWQLGGAFWEILAAGLAKRGEEKR